MIDEQQIRLWWSIFRPNNELAEVRLLGAGNVSGYFKDIETLLSELRQYANHPKFSVYFIINEINDGCYYKNQRDHLIRVGKGEGTSDKDIARRKWLLIDIDPNKYVNGVKMSEINSTDEELAATKAIGRNVYDYLKGLGFPEPVVCMSGNGTHIYYRIDEPNDKETKALIDNFLASLAQKFTTDAADVDKGVGTAARLSKLYGTVPHKGADTPERPCRMATIDYVPPTIEIVPRTLIELVANEYDDPKKQEQELHQRQMHQQAQQNPNDIPDIDVEDFLRKYNIAYEGPIYDSTRGALRYDLEECPWVSDHTTVSAPGHACIFVFPSGHKDFHCFHGHCADKDWHDFWTFYDPNLYKDAWKEQHQGQPYQQPAPMPAPVAAAPQEQEVKIIPSEEKGKAWLTLSDIVDVNLDDLEKLLTMFSQLDDTIHGLFFGELSILSGINGSGKSSWLNTLILNVIQQQQKVALWTGELQGFKIRNWMLTCAAGNYVKPSERVNGMYYVPKDIKERIVQWIDDRLVIFNNDYTAEWETMREKIEDIASQGYRLIVMDNLFALDLGDDDNNQNNKQKRFILNLCQIAKDKNIHIILVAHPRKVVSFLRKEDILGSSALQNAVDNIFIIHRVGTDFEKRAKEYYPAAIINKFKNYGNVVEITKNRDFGVVDKLCGFYYIPSCRRFSEANGKLMAYGWVGNGELVDASPIGNTASNTSANLPKPENSRTYVDYTEPRQKDLPFDDAHTDDMPF